MKKKALLLVLVLVLSLALTSCSDILSLFSAQPKDALDLFEKVSEKMESLSSYESKSVINLDFELKGVPVKIRALVHAVKAESQSDYYSYESSIDEMTIKGEDIISNNVIAYVDGKIYLSNVNGYEYGKLCSDMSKEDFEDFLKYDDNPEIDGSITTAANQKFVKNDDKSYHLTFSDFPEEEVESVVSSMHFDEETFGFKISEFKVEFKIDKKFRCTEMLMTFYSEDEEPKFTMKTSYYNFDSAEKVDFDTSEYKSVEDARIPYLIALSLDKKIDLESGKFTLNSQKFISSNLDGNELLNFDNYSVTYANDNDKFSYTMQNSYTGGEKTYYYENGKLITTDYAHSRVYNETDENARLSVTKVLDIVKPDDILITDAKMTDDGSYLITGKCTDTSKYNNILLSHKKGTYVDDEITITVKLENLEVIGISYQIFVTGTRGSYTEEYVLTFENA